MTEGANITKFYKSISASEENLLASGEKNSRYQMSQTPTKRQPDKEPENFLGSPSSLDSDCLRINESLETTAVMTPEKTSDPKAHADAPSGKSRPEEPRPQCRLPITNEDEEVVLICVGSKDDKTGDMKYISEVALDSGLQGQLVFTEPPNIDPSDPTKIVFKPSSRRSPTDHQSDSSEDVPELDVKKEGAPPRKKKMTPFVALPSLDDLLKKQRPKIKEEPRSPSRKSSSEDEESQETGKQASQSPAWPLSEEEEPSETSEQANKAPAWPKSRLQPKKRPALEKAIPGNIRPGPKSRKPPVAEPPPQPADELPESPANLSPGNSAEPEEPNPTGNASPVATGSNHSSPEATEEIEESPKPSPEATEEIEESPKPSPEVTEGVKQPSLQEAHAEPLEVTSTPRTTKGGEQKRRKGRRGRGPPSNLTPKPINKP